MEIIVLWKTKNNDDDEEDFEPVQFVKQQMIPFC